MSPALLDGDYVITKKPRAFRPGFIYVINHIDLGRIVKRLKAEKDNRLIFQGDNNSSTPEAIIAPVTPERVLGQAIFVIGKNGLKRPPSRDYVP